MSDIKDRTKQIINLDNDFSYETLDKYHADNRGNEMADLMWKPYIENQGESIPGELKVILKRKLWQPDATFFRGSKIINGDMMQYLEGLRDAGIKGVQHLIEVIKENGAIILWLEH
jgi:hypothetical protein